MGLNLDRMPGAFEEDEPHVDGERGLLILAVANHVEGALHDTDGDRAVLQVDSFGRLRIVGDLDVASTVADDDPDTENPLKVGTRSRFGAVLPVISTTNDKADLISDERRRLHITNAAHAGIATGQKDVDNVAQILMAAAGSNLNGRKFVLAQNRGGQSVFIGATGVTVGTGIELDKKSNIMLELGEYVSLFAIGQNASVDDVRILEAG